MKNMKRTFCLLFLTFLLVVDLTALQADPGADLSGDKLSGFSVAPVVSWLNGRSIELVMNNSSADQRYTSKLNWELNHICLAGAKGSLNLGNYLYFNFAALTALNSGTGEMNDYDWLYSTYPQADTTTWTNWSQSDTYLLNSYQIDYNTSLRFFRRQGWNLDLFFGFQIFQWAWTDELTDIDYPYSSSNYSDLIGENGIDYDIQYRIPYLGTGFSWNHGPAGAGLSLRYSWKVSADDHDYHKFRDIHFYDYFEDGQYLGLSAYWRCDWGESLSFSLSYDWDEVFEVGGDTHIVEESSFGRSYSYDPGGAGIAYFASSLSAALEYNY